MRDLIARIEAATRPDRELDRAIFATVYDAEARPWRKGARSIWWFKRGTGETLLYSNDPPAYTASLDAALSLVPDGQTCSIMISQYRTDVQIYLPSRSGVHSKSATPALALCAAAMRARLAMQEAGDA